MTETSTTNKPTISEEQLAQRLQGMSNAYKQQMRSPIMHTPAEAGLAFEDVTFPSEDGVPLEAWFIPCGESDKLIICNHPRWFSRSGCPTHIEPWRSLGATAGNDFEVNFIPDYKILHDAGYNVLTYDLRNFGHSGTGNGGVSSGGRFESRDVLGSLAYARDRFPDMTIGLFSRCLGCNATFFAQQRRPDLFEGVRCVLGAQPVSPGVITECMLEMSGFPMDRLDDVKHVVKLATSFTFEDMSPVKAAGSVAIPTFLYQVKDDLMTRPSDVQSMFDNIPINDKTLFWIEGTTRRWDGYTYFARHPEQMLAWLDEHMK